MIHQATTKDVVKVQNASIFFSLADLLVEIEGMEECEMTAEEQVILIKNRLEQLAIQYEMVVTEPTIQ